MKDLKKEASLPNPQAERMFETMNHSRLLELAGIPLKEQAAVNIDDHEYKMMIKDLAVAFLAFAEPGFNAYEAEEHIQKAVNDWKSDLQHYMYILQTSATAMQSAAKKLEAMLRSDEKEAASSGTSST